MSKKTIIASQALALATAGKLSVQSTAVSAEDMLTSGSKLDEVNQVEQDPTRVPRIRMDQFCSPLDICRFPTDDFIEDFDNEDFSGGKFGSGNSGSMPPPDSAPSDMSMDSGSKTPVSEPADDPGYFAMNGVIYAGDIADFGDGGPRPKIDFIVSNLPNKTMDLFLLYSDRPFGKKEPGKFDGKQGEAIPDEEALKTAFDNPAGSGDIGIPLADPESLKFITGIRVQPQKPIPAFDADGNDEFDVSNPFGKPPKNSRSVVISVNINKLGDMVTSGEIPHNVFFQVAAFPVGEDGALNLDLTQALYSDVDQFIIEVPGDEPDDPAGDSGTKGGAASGNIDSNTGSKTSNDGSTGGDSTGTDNNSSGGK